MRYELATPLLFANILRWMAPQVFRRWELSAGSVGTVKMPLDQRREAGGCCACSKPTATPVPFTLHDQIAALLRRQSGDGAGAGARPRICLLADPAADVGVALGAAGAERGAAFRGRAC